MPALRTKSGRSDRVAISNPVAAAATGLVIATRSDLPDFVRNVGILGREAYRFDGSDPRFTGQMMQGPLNPGDLPFGGNHWVEEYAAIRSGNDLLRVIGTAGALTAEEQSAVTGYVHTIQAYNFLLVLDAHTQDSIPIDVGTDVTAPVAPFRSQADAYAHVEALLDGAVTELQAGGAAFPFSLPGEFTGFNTPGTFVLFNRALRAREAITGVTSLERTPASILYNTIPCANRMLAITPIRKRRFSMTVYPNTQFSSRIANG